MGLLWKKYVCDKVAVTINDPHTRAYEGIKWNAELNNVNVEVLNRDTCALLHEQTYNFV
jgi:tRNA G26 N,N-dimethylase Trm1